MNYRIARMHGQSVVDALQLRKSAGVVGSICSEVGFIYGGIMTRERMIRSATLDLNDWGTFFLSKNTTH